MNKDKWSNVLVEWVNCLKLSKQIRNPNDLRTGEFFSSLQKLITKSAKCQTDPLTFIFDLLSKHYPRFRIANKSEIHLVDLPEDDLNSMTTLLMHYTCIYDRRDVLTSPLCHSLSSSTQIMIRRFLEKMTSKVSNSDLVKIVDECEGESNSGTIRNQWLSLPVDTSSPLQDLLKTPISKFGRLQEKDRMISALKSDLELERLEKCDLQQELKAQRTKILKFERKLDQKTSEIQRLRSETLEKENRSPSNIQDNDNDLNRRLKSEIESLELYVKKLDSEQEQLMKERDDYCKKLRLFEGEVSMWQDKFFELERSFEELSLHSKSQDGKVEVLEAECEELRAFLDEYRSRPLNDSSCYEKLPNSPSCENLACSVVEVQLKDAQDANNQLKLKFEEVEVFLKGKIMNLEESLRKFQMENEELLKLKRTLEEESKIQTQKFTEIKLNFDKVNEESQYQILKISELEEVKSRIEEKLIRVEDCNNNLLKESEDLTEKCLVLDTNYKELESKSKSLDFQIEDLQLIKSQLEVRLEEVYEVNKVLNTKNDEMEKVLTNLRLENENFAQNLVGIEQNFKQFREEKEILIESLQNELDNKEKELGNQIQEVSELNQQLEGSQSFSAILKSENEDLKMEARNFENKCDQLENEKSLVDEKLLELEQVLKTKEKEFEKVQVMISQLNDDLNSKCAEIVQLEKEHFDLEAELTMVRAQNDKLQKDIDNLTKMNENLQQTLTIQETYRLDLTKKVQELECTSKIANLKLSNLKCTKSKVESELVNAQEQISSTKTQLKEMEENRMILEKEVEMLENQYEEISKGSDFDLEKLQEEFSEIQKRYNSRLVLEKEVAHLETAQFKLEDDLSKSEADKQSLEVELTNLKAKNDDLEQENLSIMKSNEHLQESVEILNIEIDELAREHEELKKSLESEVSKYEDAENARLKLVDKLATAQQQIGASKAYLTEVEQQVIVARQEIDVLRTEYDEVTEKNAILLKSVEELEKEKAEIENKLMNIQEELNSVKSLVEEIGLEKVTLKSELTNLMTRNDEIRKENVSLIRNNKKLQKDYLKLTEITKELEVKSSGNSKVEGDLIKALEEVMTCSAKLDNLEVKLAKNEKSHNIKVQALEKSKSDVEEQLVSTREKLKSTNAKLTDVTNELEIKSSDNSKLEGDLIKAVEEVKTCSDKLDNLEAKLVKNAKSHNIKVEALEEEKSDVEKQLLSTRKELNSTKAKFEEIESQKLELETKLTNLVTENDEVVRNNEHIQRCSLYLNNLVEKLQESVKIESVKVEELKKSKSEVEDELAIVYDDFNATKVNFEAILKEKTQLQENCDKLTAANAKLLEENQILVGDFREKSGVYEEKIATLERNLEEFEELLKYQSSTIQELRISMRALQDENDDIKLMNSELLEEKREFDETFNHLDDEFNKLKTNYESQEVKLKEFELVKYFLEDQVKEAHDSNESLLRKLELNETATNDLKLENDYLKSAYSELNTKNEETCRSNESLQKKLMNSEIENGKLIHNFETLSANLQDFDKMKSKLAESEDKFESLQKSNQDLQQKLGELNNQMQDRISILEVEKSEIQTEFELICGQKLNLEQELEKSRKDFDLNLEKLKLNEETIQDYEMTISGLKSALDENLQTLTSLKNDRSLLECEVEGVKNEFKNHEELLRNLLETLKSFKIIDEDSSENDENLTEVVESNLKKFHLNEEKLKVDFVNSRDDLKKKNLMLKQKLVLTENSKNNLEKIIKNLREENRKTQNVEEKPPEDNEKLLGDIKNIQNAYSQVKSTNSKLELEVSTLRKLIEERNLELADLSLIKEAYEKLLEENNKLQTETDTLKYKRSRDKDEYVRLLRKEREESKGAESKKVQDIRNEYEAKLEKMKTKMLQLYREEVNKEVQKMKTGQTENSSLMKTLENLQSDLFEAEQKIQLLEMERDMLKSKEGRCSGFFLRPDQSDRRVSTVTSRMVGRPENIQRASTLPRSMMVEEITLSRRTSINSIRSSIGRNLQMEDEDDDFNNKYLTDMKEGKCALPIVGRESTSSRYSELAWRNSLVPPHLKSSYPAEVQFVSPERFKEEDLKAGNVELDNSSCKLLPGDKPRRKDVGTTSYKKPGPPTPSKNGGRLSLQGNEVHPIREVEKKTPKTSTPSRIRALFTSRSSINKENSESQGGTPNKTRRLNIFRRPK